MAKNVPSLVGERFGRWIVLDKAEKGKSGEIQYLCRCDCGNERIIRRTSLTTGNSKSCGCLSRDVAVKSNTKHGDTDKRLYRIWAGIIQRCCNNRNRYEWEKYGGRGICVCDEWKQYEAFRDWSLANGYNDNLSIDRIDPNGNYCPENCRWATSYQQANNKRTSKFITFNGKTATVKEFADEYDIAYSCLYARLRNGWSVEKALLTPAKQIKKITNAQKIWAMSDEELARRWCVKIPYGNLCANVLFVSAFTLACFGSEDECVTHNKKWLKQPAEE